MIYLQTPRLIIRDVKFEDLNNIFSLYHNKKATYFLPARYMETIENAKETLDNAIGQIAKEDRQYYFLCIEDKQNKAHIGTISCPIKETTPIGKSVGVGYFIRLEYWGKGYATEALQEIIRFAFEENNVFRIEAGCLKENAASIKVMIKCGMIKEAEFKNCTWHDGKIKDRVSYRLLKSEWIK